MAAQIPLVSSVVSFNEDGSPKVDGLPCDDIGYMRRYYLRRVYESWSCQLHHIVGDDPFDDLHDHPWDFVSVLLSGGYRDISRRGAVEHHAPCIIPRRAEDPHRLELLGGPVWSLVSTGPVRRRWGYHTSAGWVPWQVYHSGRR